MSTLSELLAGLSQEPTRTATSLEGVVVLDITRVVAGPYCSMILGGPRRDGDQDRAPREPRLRARLPAAAVAPTTTAFSAFFAQFNRNKLGLTLDLAHRRTARRCCARSSARADVLVENFRAGTMDKLGLGLRDACASVNPRLVYTALSGYGQTGPYRAPPGLRQQRARPPAGSGR